jgi:hypothetical protein
MTKADFFLSFVFYIHEVTIFVFELRALSIYTDSWKKILIRSVETPFFATTWVKNDPFVVNGIKSFF